MGSASSRFNSFTRPNSSGLAYPCLTSTNRAGEATTPISSNSATSRSTAFKNPFPMSSPYFSCAGTPVTGIPSLQVKFQPGGSQSGLGVFPSLAANQRSIYVPATKVAVQASQEIHGKSKGMTATVAMAGSYTGRQTPMDGTPVLNSWEDPSSWGSKRNLLPRPQLSFADRSTSLLHTSF